MRDRLQAEMLSMASQGLRVLGFGYKTETNSNAESFSGKLERGLVKKGVDGYYPHESDLVFVGLAGILDPPRVEVSESIQKCFDSGVRVKVITGDHKATAESICRQIGLFRENESAESLKEKSITGKELMALGESERHEAADKAMSFD